ncbi:hypothetical protein H4S01_003495 [Coemansia sp. RSA 2610]|nr:hypothetical protein H4S01_003495 [Coemansia sp. RSA 2610]
MGREQKLTVLKLARMAFAVSPEDTRTDLACADDLLDPMAAVTVFQLATGCQPKCPVQLETVRKIWAEEVLKQRRLAAQKASRVSIPPERRSARETRAREPGFYDAQMKPPPLELGSTRDRQSAKNKTAVDSNGPVSKRARQSPDDIQDEITRSNDIIRINSTSNRPDVAQLARIRDYVPLVLPGTDEEPSHAIVEPRVVKQINKKRHQAQGLHEYAIDGFPVPVNPERWLALQKQKYETWLLQAAGCTKVLFENYMQTSVCLTSEPYGMAMCHNCIHRQTDSYCQFRNVHMATKLCATLANGEEFTRYMLVPMFASEPKAREHRLTVAPTVIPERLNEEFGDTADWPMFYILLMTARTLLPTLDMISHVLGVPDEDPAYVGKTAAYDVHPQLGCSSAPCVYRTLTVGTRQFCDACQTSILSTYFSCSMCGQELCPRCFSEWDDSGTEVRVVGYSSMSAYNKRTRLSSCKRIARAGTVKVAACHKRQQFIRVSQFVREDIERVREKAERVLAQEHISPTIDCGGVLSADELGGFHAKIQRICERTRHTYTHEAWELPVVYVEAGELSTAEFSRLWRRGIVVVIRGLLQALDSTLWKPDWWIRNFGYEMVNVLDCNRNAAPVGEWPLRDFYRLFDGEDSNAHMFDEDMETASNWAEHKERVADSILKLKDWPPAEDFQTRLPDHFARFMDALPFPEYTQRDGKFNLANQLPSEFVPPDLGPKMYCAYGSSDGEGGVGTTNLHCDMADAVNIMAYASPKYLRAHGIEVPGIWTREDGGGGDESMAVDGQPDKPPTGAAVWDIYPPEAVANLRQYIRRQKYADNAEGDPIHDQATFLTRPMRQAIYKQFGSAGGSCYRIYQNPGDAVFVPAGCAHQVCNYASAVKIAMDFVSPERVEHCRRLTGEFRRLDSKHPRGQDLLQLNSILWWTFAGKQTKARK